MLFKRKRKDSPKIDIAQQAVEEYNKTMKVMLELLAHALMKEADSLKENNIFGKAKVELSYFELVQIVSALTLLETLKETIKD